MPQTSLKVIRKYVCVFMKRNLTLVFFCATLCAIPLFVAALIYDFLPYDIYMCLIPYVFGALIIIMNHFVSFRFKKIIEKQEESFNVSFSDKDERQLNPTVFLTEEWLIFAGRYAFYKKNIESIKSKIADGRSIQRRHKLTVIETDGHKTNIVIYQPSVVKKIKEWNS